MAAPRATSSALWSPSAPTTARRSRRRPRSTREALAIPPTAWSAPEPLIACARSRDDRGRAARRHPAPSSIASERARAEVDLGRILRAALTAPGQLSSSALAEVEMALGAGASDARRIVALGVLAAILYTRPDLVGRSTVLALAEMVPSAGSLGRMRSSTGSPKLTEGAARTLGLFAGSPAATAAAEALIGQLVRRRLPGPCRIALLKSLAVH